MQWMSLQQVGVSSCPVYSDRQHQLVILHYAQQCFLAVQHAQVHETAADC